MLEACGYKCEICGDGVSLTSGKNKAPHIDHDHTTGKVRGILCASCNKGIGMLKEDTSVLQKAIRYLTERATYN
jgi:predicted nucleic acid-binding Zn ribbon protein